MKKSLWIVLVIAGIGLSIALSILNSQKAQQAKRPVNNTNTAAQTKDPASKSNAIPKAQPPKGEPAGSISTAAGENTPASEENITVEQVAFDSGTFQKVYGQVFWAPDGKRFAYVSDEGSGRLGIYVAQAGITGKGKRIKALTYDTVFASPFVSLSWTPDGTGIYYLFDTSIGSEYRPYLKLGRLDPATGEEKPIRMRDMAVLPATVTWAPQAGKLSFLAEGWLQRVDLATGRTVRLLRMDSRDGLFTLAAAPGGTKLAYTRVFGYRSAAQERVFVLDVMTGKETQVSSPDKYSWKPMWFKHGDKLGFLTSEAKADGFGVIQGEDGPLSYSDGISVVTPTGQKLKDLKFNGEHILGFSPMAAQADALEVYTGSMVQMSGMGGISFVLETHRIVQLPEGNTSWEKKFPKGQVGENNGVQWIDDQTWVNSLLTPGSLTRTIILKNANDKELAKVDGVVDQLFTVENGLVFARQTSSGQAIWYLSKAGKLTQLTENTGEKRITGVKDGRVVYQETSADGKAQNLKMLTLTFKAEEPVAQ